VAAQLGRLVVLGAVWGCLGAIFVIAIAVSIRYRLHEPMEERLTDRISAALQAPESGVGEGERPAAPLGSPTFDAGHERGQRAQRGQATRLIPSHFGGAVPPARDSAPAPGAERTAPSPPAPGGNQGPDR